MRKINIPISEEDVKNINICDPTPVRNTINKIENEETFNELKESGYISNNKTPRSLINQYPVGTVFSEDNGRYRWVILSKIQYTPITNKEKNKFKEICKQFDYNWDLIKEEMEHDSTEGYYWCMCVYDRCDKEMEISLVGNVKSFTHKMIFTCDRFEISY